MALKKSITRLLILAPFLGLLGYTGYRVYQEMNKSEAPAGPGGAGGPGGPGGARRGGPGGGGRAVQVQTGVAAMGRISESITLTGSLRAKESVDVSPRVAGRLTQLLVDTGQVVAKGALLATIEDDEIRQQIERSNATLAVVDAQITQREAELANARIELDRRIQLVEAGVLSRNELDTLEMRHTVARSQLELARAQRRQSEAEQRELSIRLGQTRIASPISGIISRRLVATGALVTSANPIVTVVSVNPMIVDAQASERDIARVRRGLTVNVTIDSLPGETFTGRIMRISPTLDPQTRNGMLEIEIANLGGALKGEMFARINLDLGTSHESILIPRDALVYRGDQPGAYTIEEEKAKYLPLQTGLTQGDKVEVLDGLVAGDLVITRGSNMLKEGDAVRVLELNSGGRGQRRSGPGGEPAAGAPPSTPPKERGSESRSR